MSAVRYPDLIAKKRNGEALTDQEMSDFVRGVTNGDMSDSQIGAMLMAMYLKDLSPQEVTTLTREMTNSGQTMQWPKDWEGSLVDKHSTGGVGDKTSLVLMPALAALGLKVPTISGRGLAHTGGTLDKLESIPGFTVSLTSQELIKVVETVGVVIAGQTENICPADKKLYATRDITGTVGHIGLVTGSIVSKKIAENINSLILDVKTGVGALIPDVERATQLAHSMVACAQSQGVNAVALITDMDSPLGNMVGNALEVAECVHCLQGKGPDDLLDLVVELGGHLVHTHSLVLTAAEGCDKVRQVIADGLALAKFRDMLKGQGVEQSFADELCNPGVDIWTKLTPAQYKTECVSHKDGYIKRIDAMDIAVVTHMLGGGRNKPGEAVNWAVGVELLLDIGDQIKIGQPWVLVHHDKPLSDDVMNRLRHTLEVSNQHVDKRAGRVLKVIEN